MWGTLQGLFKENKLSKMSLFENITVQENFSIALMSSTKTPYTALPNSPSEKLANKSFFI